MWWWILNFDVHPNHLERLTENELFHALISASPLLHCWFLSQLGGVEVSFVFMDWMGSHHLQIEERSGGFWVTSTGILRRRYFAPTLSMFIVLTNHHKLFNNERNRYIHYKIQHLSQPNPMQRNLISKLSGLWLEPRAVPQKQKQSPFTAALQWELSDVTGLCVFPSPSMASLALRSQCDSQQCPINSCVCRTQENGKPQNIHSPWGGSVTPGSWEGSWLGRPRRRLRRGRQPHPRARVLGCCLKLSGD